MLSLVIDRQIQVLLEMDNGFSTKQWKHGRRRLLITRNNIVLWKNCDLELFQINHKISNQIQIKSHVFEIKSLFFKSNHYVWFNHDLNQIMIWICPSLAPTEAEANSRVQCRTAAVKGRSWRLDDQLTKRAVETVCIGMLKINTIPLYSATSGKCSCSGAVVSQSRHTA